MIIIFTSFRYITFFYQPILCPYMPENVTIDIKPANHCLFCKVNANTLDKRQIKSRRKFVTLNTQSLLCNSKLGNPLLRIFRCHLVTNKLFIECLLLLIHSCFCNCMTGPKAWWLPFKFYICFMYLHINNTQQTSGK